MLKNFFLVTIMLSGLVVLSACGSKKVEVQGNDVMQEGQQMSEQDQEMLKLETDFEAFKKQKKQEAGVE